MSLDGLHDSSTWSHAAPWGMLHDSAGKPQSCVNAKEQPAQKAPDLTCESGVCTLSLDAAYDTQPAVAASFNRYARSVPGTWQVSCHDEDEPQPTELNFAFCGKLGPLPVNEQGRKDVELCVGQDNEGLGHPWYAASPDLHISCDDANNLHATRKLRPPPPPPPPPYVEPAPAPWEPGGGFHLPKWLRWVLIALAILLAVGIAVKLLHR